MPDLELRCQLPNGYRDTDRKCQKVRFKKNIGLSKITEDSWKFSILRLYQFRLHRNDQRGHGSAVSLRRNDPEPI